MSEWITAEEAIEIMGVHRSTFYKRIKESEVATDKNGQKKVYKAEDIRKLANGEAVPKKQEPEETEQEPVEKQEEAAETEEQETKLEETPQEPEKPKTEEAVEQMTSYDKVYAWVSFSENVTHEEVMELLTQVMKDTPNNGFRVIDVSGDDLPKGFAEKTFVIASPEAKYTEAKEYVVNEAAKQI